jgi:hypothetical protein
VTANANLIGCFSDPASESLGHSWTSAAFGAEQSNISLVAVRTGRLPANRCPIFAGGTSAVSVAEMINHHRKG